MKEYRVRVRYPGEPCTDIRDSPIWMVFQEGEEATMERFMRAFLNRHYLDAPAWKPVYEDETRTCVIGFFVTPKSGAVINPFAVEIAIDGVLP